MSKAEKSLEVFLQGDNLRAIQKLGNGESHYVTIPYKHFANITSGELFIDHLLNYFLGGTKDVKFNISHDARAYILANCSLC